MGVENILEGTLRALEGERATVQVRNRAITRPVVRSAAELAGQPGRRSACAPSGSSSAAPKAGGRARQPARPAGRRPRSTRASISTRASRPRSARSRRGSGTVTSTVADLGPVVGRSGLHDHAAALDRPADADDPSTSQSEPEGRQRMSEHRQPGEALTRREVLQGRGGGRAWWRRLRPIRARARRRSRRRRSSAATGSRPRSSRTGRSWRRPSASRWSSPGPMPTSACSCAT